MQNQIKDLDRLLDIQEFSAFVLEHRPKTSEAFLENKVLRLGILKALENIGEAAHKISNETKSEFTQLDWKAMIAARHVYVHDYFRIDWENVWDSINTVDFEEIIKSVQKILDTLKQRFSL